jgi:hypothetical protein
MEITVHKAADRLGVTPGRVRQLISMGRIKARHLTARMMLIDERELSKPNVKNRAPGRPARKRKGR